MKLTQTFVAMLITWTACCNVWAGDVNTEKKVKKTRKYAKSNSASKAGLIKEIEDVLNQPSPYGHICKTDIDKDGILHEYQTFDGIWGKSTNYTRKTKLNDIRNYTLHHTNLKNSSYYWISATCNNNCIDHNKNGYKFQLNENQLTLTDDHARSLKILKYFQTLTNIYGNTATISDESDQDDASWRRILAESSSSSSSRSTWSTRTIGDWQGRRRNISLRCGNGSDAFVYEYSDNKVSPYFVNSPSTKGFATLDEAARYTCGE